MMALQNEEKAKLKVKKVLRKMGRQNPAFRPFAKVAIEQIESAKMSKPAKRKNPLIGKTIASFEQCGDGILFDLVLHFTDGTSASFLLQTDPEFELRYFAKDVGAGRKLKIPFVGEKS